MEPIKLNRLGWRIIKIGFLLLIFKGVAVFVGGENHLLEIVTSYIAVALFIIGGGIVSEAYHQTKQKETL